MVSDVSTKFVARKFYPIFYPNEDKFSAREGRLNGFKIRYSLKCLSISGEKLRHYEQFKDDFSKFIIYNKLEHEVNPWMKIKKKNYLCYETNYIVCQLWLNIIAQEKFVLLVPFFRIQYFSFNKALSHSRQIASS